MSLKSTAIVGVLILSQAALVWANPATPEHSAEYKMFKRAIAIQGTAMSDSEKLDATNSILSQYAKIAQPDGQEDRMKTALLDLGVYTPEQLAATWSDAKILTSSINSSQPISVQEKELATVAETLSTMHPVAAQFSACQAANGMLLGGFATAMIEIGAHGGVVDSVDNPVSYDVTITALAISVAGFIMHIASC